MAATLNWLVDPFRYFHVPWFEIGYSENQRHQNPGLARTEEYRIVLIGTSHTEPFAASEIGEALGRRALNLSVSGSLIEEQYLLTHLILREGKAGRVLWEINYPSFVYGEGVSAPATFPFFLYQPGIETPFRYLLSWDTFRESLEALYGDRPAQLDSLHRWDLNATFGEERVLEHWDYMTRRWTDDLRSHFKKHSIEQFELDGLIERYIASLVKQFPEVQFEFLLLPSTLLEYSNDLQVHAERLDQRLLLRNKIAEMSGEFHNARVWDFQSVDWMTREFRHYKDLDHFGQTIVKAVLTSLAAQQDVTAPQQVMRNTESLSRKITAFTQAFCKDLPEKCQPVLLENLKEFRSRNLQFNFGP